MSFNLNGTVLGKHLDIRNSFDIDQSQKLIKTKKGVQEVRLNGSNLVTVLQDGSSITTPLSSLVPATKADKFLKTISYNSGTKKLVFTVGNDLNATTETLEVSVADFLPVVAGNGLQGNGTTESPLQVKLDTSGSNALTINTNGLKLDVNQLKPVATVELLDVFGERIGYVLTESQRRAS